MRISSSDPLASRATSAAKKPVGALTARVRKQQAGVAELLEQPDLVLEAWSAHTSPEDLAAPAPVYPSLLVLPFPPSVNTLTRARAMQVHGRWMAQVYKTAEHRKYVESVEAAAGYIAAPWPEGVELAVRITLFRPRRVGDIDGPIKALFDSLNGRAWFDDSQIVDLHVTRRDDKHRPRVELSINAAPTQE